MNTTNSELSGNLLVVLACAIVVTIALLSLLSCTVVKHTPNTVMQNDKTALLNTR